MSRRHCKEIILWRHSSYDTIKLSSYIVFDGEVRWFSWHWNVHYFPLMFHWFLWRFFKVLKIILLPFASRKDPMNLAFTFPLMTLIFRIKFQSLHDLGLSKASWNFTTLSLAWFLLYLWERPNSCTGHFSILGLFYVLWCCPF